MNADQRRIFFRRLTKAARDRGIYRPTDLAKKSGLSPITVAAYMRSTRGASFEHCVAMAEILNCNPYWLYGEAVEEHEPIVPKIKTEARPSSLAVIDEALSRMTIPEIMAAIQYLSRAVAEKGA